MEILSGIALIFLIGGIAVAILSMRDNEKETKSTQKAIAKMFGGNN